MNILNIKSMKEKINLVRNYFGKFSIKQKIIGAIIVFMTLIVGMFFLFFYESEEDKLRITLEERLTNFMYEDFEFPEMLKKDLVKYWRDYDEKKRKQA